MMMAVIFLNIVVKCSFSIPRSLLISMKVLQDFPKIHIELMERLITLVLRYFEERSGVSCRYLSPFLSALMFVLVSNPTVSSTI